MHVNAVQKLARSYEHIAPTLVGNAQNILVSELSGQSNILIRPPNSGCRSKRTTRPCGGVLARIKDLEKEGYAFEAAGASLELLLRRETGRYARPSNCSNTAADSAISRTNTPRSARRR